jgi:hypothetical protein
MTQIERFQVHRSTFKAEKNRTPQYHLPELPRYHLPELPQLNTRRVPGLTGQLIRGKSRKILGYVRPKNNY